MEYTKEEKDKLSKYYKRKNEILEKMTIIDDQGMADVAEEPYYDKAYLDHQIEEQEQYARLQKDLDVTLQRIYDIDNGARSREKTKQWEEERKLFTKGSFVNEHVSDAQLKEDIFSQKQKAITIANELCDPKVGSPYNIAILGNWGTGKTSFCRYIKEAISQKNKEKNKKNNYKIVDFNAAEYSSKVLSEIKSEHIEQQWSNLLKVMFEAYEKEHSIIGTIRYNRIHLCEKTQLGQILIYLICIGLVFIPLLLVEGASQLWDISDDYIAVLGKVSKLVGFTLAMLPVVKNALVSLIPISERVKSATKLPSYVDILGTREKIVFDTKVLLKAWLKKPDEKIFIFIDDCDRCSTEGIMEFFESMHLFLDLEKVFFIFAIDPRLLKTAIAKYYSKNGSDALVTHFLQKYISRVYSIEESDYSNLVDSMSKIIEPDSNDKHCLTDEEYKDFLDCISTESITPRSVKQLLNTIVSLKNYYMSDQELGGQFFFKDVMGWYIMNYYYTSICNQLRSFLRIDYSRYTLKNIIEISKIDAEDLRKSKVFAKIADCYIIDFILIELNMGMMIRRSVFNDSDMNIKAVE